MSASCINSVPPYIWAASSVRRLRDMKVYTDPQLKQLNNCIKNVTIIMGAKNAKETSNHN